MGVVVVGVWAAGEPFRHRPAFHLVPTQGADQFHHLALHADEIVQIGFQPNQFGAAQGGIAVGHALFKARDAIGFDGKGAVGDAEIHMGRV